MIYETEEKPKDTLLRTVLLFILFFVFAQCVLLLIQFIVVYKVGGDLQVVFGVISKDIGEIADVIKKLQG